MTTPDFIPDPISGSLRRALVLSFLTLGIGGCFPTESAPGTEFEGLLEAPSPLLTPMSETPACLVGLSLRTRRQAGRKGTSSHQKSNPRWAQGATLKVAGEQLRITGPAGSPTFTKVGDQWGWTKYEADRRPPPTVMGWGHDQTLLALHDPEVTHYYTHVDVEEIFTPCGETIRVRAMRTGDTLSLVDTNPTQSRNALRGFGILALVFFGLLVLPIVGLIIFIARRARRRT